MNFNNDFDFIDTHCHLDLYKNYKTVVLDSCKQKTFVIAVTNIPSVFEHECTLFQKDKNIAVALGFHPQLVESYGDQIELFTSLLPKAKFIGEIGLDYQDNNETRREKQRKVFKRIIKEIAKYSNKVISVHSRNSTDDVISIIGKNYQGCIILHWYSGSLKSLRTAISNGYYFSVNPSMTKTQKGQTIIKSIPLERLLTETDGPFLKMNDSSVKPSDVENVVKYLSFIHKKNIEEVKNIIKANFLKIADIKSIVSSY